MADDKNLKTSLSQLLADMNKGAQAANPLASFFAATPFPVVGQWYLKKRINLDGYTFTRCHFDKCELYVAKGNFFFDQCKLTSCTVLFDKDAYNAVQLFNIFTTESWSKWPALTPILNTADGTYTLRRAA